MGTKPIFYVSFTNLNIPQSCALYPAPWSCWQCLLDWPSLYRPYNRQGWRHRSFFFPCIFPHFSQGNKSFCSYLYVPSWYKSFYLLKLKSTAPTSVDAEDKSWLCHFDMFPIGSTMLHLRFCPLVQRSVKAHLGQGQYLWYLLPA